MNYHTKSEALARQLAESILGGSLAPRSRLPREVEWAAQLGVSRETLRNALGVLEKRRLVERVKGKGTFVREAPREREVVKLILPGPGIFARTDNSGVYMRRLVGGASSEASRLGARLELVLSTDDHRQESFDPEMFRGFARDDRIILPSGWWRPIFPALAASGCRVAYSQAGTEGLLTEHAAAWRKTYVDYAAVVREALRYFVAAGRRRIITFDMSGEEERAWLEEAQATGASLDPRLRIPGCYADYLGGDGGPNQRFHDHYPPLLRRAVFEAKADAVFFNIQPMAAFLEPTLLEGLGVGIPGDLACLCLTDHADLERLPVPLTAFDYSAAALGRNAVAALCAEVFAPSTAAVTPTMIERESSRPGAGSGVNPFAAECRPAAGGGTTMNLERI